MSNNKIDSPLPQYEYYADSWEICRAIIGGNRAVKEYDLKRNHIGTINTSTYRNNLRNYQVSNDSILVPLNPTMSYNRWRWYLKVGVLPGLVSHYVKIMVGGMTHKPPTFQLDESVPNREIILDWINNYFTIDGMPLLHFLDLALTEELTTGHTFIRIDYSEEHERPIPIIMPAEEVINWDVISGRLTRVITKSYIYVNTPESPFHKTPIPVIYMHGLDPDGFYYMATYYKLDNNNGTGAESDPVLNGYQLVNLTYPTNMQGFNLDFIPIYQMRGKVDPVEPPLQPMVDKEIELYNMESMRNHILRSHGSPTLVFKTELGTVDPVIQNVQEQDAQNNYNVPQQRTLDNALDAIENGSVITIEDSEELSVLDHISNHVEPHIKVIESTKQYIHALGFKMLGQINQAESGVALDMKNRESSAVLSNISRVMSSTFKEVIRVMVFWQYGIELNSDQITLLLASDLTGKVDTVSQILLDLHSRNIINDNELKDQLKDQDIISPDVQ